jgi:hypothetical protein
VSKNKHEGKRVSSSKKKTSSLAFVGGLIFASIAAGVILTKNEGIRTELETQAKSLLNTSREFLRKLHLTDNVLGKLFSDHKTANYNSTIETSHAPGPKTVLPDAYNSLWQEAERQNSGRQNSATA